VLATAHVPADLLTGPAVIKTDRQGTEPVVSREAAQEKEMGDLQVADAAKGKVMASNLTIDILQITKLSQSQHGLRHNDHARYRCANSTCKKNIVTSP